MPVLGRFLWDREPRMMRSAVRLVVAALVLAASFGMQPARAQGGLAGTGTASGLGCSGSFVIQGAGVGTAWAFSVQYAGATSVGCASAVVGAANGTWNPAAGGCVPGGTGLICVGPVPVTGTQTVSVSFCVIVCRSGTASITRAL